MTDAFVPGSWGLVLALGVLVLTGCSTQHKDGSGNAAHEPSSARSRRDSAERASTVQHLSDDAEAVAKLQKMATLKRDRAQRVIGVELRGADVDDQVLALLQGIPNVQSLSLSGCGVTDAGLQMLNQLGALQALTMVDLPIGDAGLAHLAKQKNLRRLKIARCPELTAQGFAAIANCRQLVQLDLRDFEQATGEITAQIAKLPHLKDLKLNSPNLTDGGLAPLAALTGLTADATGIGEGTGVGWKQITGAVIGVVIAAIGMIRLRRP